MARNAASMDLDGLGEVLKNLDQLGLKVEGALKDAALRAGAEETKDLIEKHPNLPRSNKAKQHAADMFVIEKTDDDVYDIGVESDGFYLLFHEIGALGGVYKNKEGEHFITPDIPAKPFVRPAFEGGATEIQRKMGEVIKRGLGL
jgi:HK97 gp10 family phage protein